MKVKRSLSLAAASAIVDGALAIARQQGFDPLTVVVLDSGGIPIAFKSEDGCGILRYNVALGKAYGPLGMGTSSRDLGDRMAARPNFSNALSAASDGRFIPVPGGVLIMDEDGAAVGSVGISGDVSAKDEFCAIHAIRDAGFTPEPAKVDESLA